MEVITRERIKSILKPRDPKGDKFTFGTALVIAGSEGYTGAPFFSSSAAVHSGCGLVRLIVPESIWSVEATKLNEVMVTPVEDDTDGRISPKAIDKILQFALKANAVLIGPGCGLYKGLYTILTALLKNITVPLVIDADGLNMLSDDMSILKYAASDVVLTPHKKEFARLYKEKIIPNNSTLKSFAEEHAVTLVYKEAETRIATSDGRIIVNKGKANSGMAKGGSGDVLSGMITAFLTEGYTAAEASTLAVYIHSLAGEHALSEKGVYAMTPTDVLFHIATAMKELG